MFIRRKHFFTTALHYCTPKMTLPNAASFYDIGGDDLRFLIGVGVCLHRNSSRFLSTQTSYRDNGYFGIDFHVLNPPGDEFGGCEIIISVGRQSMRRVRLGLKSYPLFFNNMPLFFCFSQGSTWISMEVGANMVLSGFGWYWAGDSTLVSAALSNLQPQTIAYWDIW